MARRSKALVSVDAMKAQLAKRAEEDETIVGEGGASNFISTRNSKFTYKSEQLADPLEVVILAYAQDFSYYDQRFDPDNPTPPACFAVAACKEIDLVPDEDAPKPQHDNCIDCPQNEFGSAGKGKACRNAYRLAVVAADTPDGDIAMIRIAPTGRKNFENYVNRLRRANNTLPLAVYTQLTFTEDDYPCVEAFMTEEISEADVLQTCIEREQEALDMVTTPFYQPDQYEEPRERQPRRKRGKRSNRGNE